jgi:Tfp pilus assembly protein PilE
MLEIITVLIIIGLLAMIVRLSYSSVVSSSNELATRPVLGSVQVEGRRLVAQEASITNIPAFPSNMASQLTVSGLEITTEESTSPNRVSIHLVDNVTAVYASSGGGVCVILVDRLVGSAGWGSDDDSTSCTASLYVNLIENVTGSYGEPTDL